MNNPLTFNQNALNYIDSLQDEKTLQILSSCLDVNAITNIFWQAFVNFFTAKLPLERQKAALKCDYVNRYFGSFIPLNPNVNRFNTPHGFYGIFISNDAKIGKGCTIFQNVTIGSNTLLDSKNAGAPTIGENVYIGAGAEIIGDVTIGNNVRIGAGCSVTRDVPDNCTVVQATPRVIQKSIPQDNRWVNISDYHKLKAEQIQNIKSPPPPEMDLPFNDLFGVVEKNIYRAADEATAMNYADAFKILFCGDLILLEDQVKRAFDGRGYDFNDMFEFTRKYISGADFAIGVFEGPLGGKAALYSQSNYGDGKGLYLNFPDEFADAVKNAGFDLVTTANNHVLDMGVDGLKRTIHVLCEKNLDYIGSYLDAPDKAKSRVKIVEKGGLKIAVLAYTGFVNNFNTEQLLSDKLSYLTSVIAYRNQSEFDGVLAGVKEDFALAKSHKPDLIIVLPHWGEQFTDAPNDYQKLWRDIFIQLGADIVLGCHTHSVQPATIETIGGKTTYTLYCPGNYANIYREYNGDASLLAEVYIDRRTKKILGGAIIPMWTRSALAGNYRPLPIWEILTNDKLRREVSTFELERIAYVLKHITRVTLGTELNETLIQERFFFDERGFKRKKVAPLELSNDMRGTFYKALVAADNVCFVGDSITHGTKNGGVPWYEPLAPLIGGQIFNASFGGATIKRLIAEPFLSKIVAAPANLFVVAIGTNDVRYRNPAVCAMTPEEYIACLNVLRIAILKKNSAAKFVFIAPWTSTDGDKVSALPYRVKIQLNNIYTEILKQWCTATGDAFVNANPRIKAVLDCRPHSDYLTDWIHPNARAGVNLYSEAVLKA